ncbi:MAG: C40 family peptidase, partial [Bacteroidia bacterium]
LVDLVTKTSDNSLTPVIAGSTLPAYEHGKLYVGDEEFSFDGEITHPLSDSIPALVSEYATVFLNAPYLWGGRSVFGIDCSGFTQVVFKMAGIQLKRDAYQQAEQGITLSFVEEAQTGDLAFFDNEEGKIVHTGIVLSQGKIIHASGKVRIDKLDHQGIYNHDTKKYSHKLRLIKRVLQK